MKAMICAKYGSPLEVIQLKEVEKPIPAENQVLINVQAASINKSDLAPIRGPFVARLLGTGLLRPKSEKLGSDVAGRVEAVGNAVKQFKSGDEVFGSAPGSIAEYACAREDRLVLKPAKITYEEAASVPVAAISALQGLRKGLIKPEQKVLIYGASGGVGTFAVQIAKSFGTEVTAVCSTRNIAQTNLMGAARIIDYTQENFTQDGMKYDLILAVNGQRPLSDYRNALSPKGICVVLGGTVSQVFQALVFGPIMSKNSGKKIGFMGIARLNQEDLTFLKELLEAGKIKPIVEKSYPLIKTAEAMKYLEEGHAQGKVVISLKPEI